MAGKKVTITDIAKACGVGLATASRAINGKPGVKEDVRRKVLIYIEEIGWRCNTIERRFQLPVEGKSVVFVAPSSTNVSGAVAYAVEIRFDPGEYPVRLGMTADVDIVVDSAGDALLVPNRAIEADREAGRYYVTRQKSLGGTERLEVRIGMRDQANTQILEGVEEGDKLVLPTIPEQGADSGFGGPGEGRGMFGGMRE